MRSLGQETRMTGNQNLPDAGSMTCEKYIERTIRRLRKSVDPCTVEFTLSISYITKLCLPRIQQKMSNDSVIENGLLAVSPTLLRSTVVIGC
jgi:hypothetical protein